MVKNKNEKPFQFLHVSAYIWYKKHNEIAVSISTTKKMICEIAVIFSKKNGKGKIKS